MKKIKVNNFEISNSNPFSVIVGPCVIENKEHTLKIAESIAKICESIQINYIFKASFDKANRTSIESQRGVVLDKALEIFREVKSNFNCPILTDVHNEKQCKDLSSNDIVDIIQIPAFLCRQTDLLIAAGNSNKIINVKKGQFLSPQDIPNII